MDDKELIMTTDIGLISLFTFQESKLPEESTDFGEHGSIRLQEEHFTCVHSSACKATALKPDLTRHCNGKWTGSYVALFFYK